MAVVVWIAFAALVAGGDVGKPVYGWLEFAARVCALLVAILILVTQRRADELAERRAHTWIRRSPSVRWWRLTIPRRCWP